MAFGKNSISAGTTSLAIGATSNASETSAVAVGFSGPSVGVISLAVTTALSLVEHESEPVSDSESDSDVHLLIWA